MEGLVKLVGANIKEIRIQKGLTREQLAEKCSLQPSYLAGVERGERNITLQTLEKISTGLEISSTKIFQFGDIQIENQYFNKEELLKVLFEKLMNRSEREITMVIKIVDEILNVIEN